MLGRDELPQHKLAADVNRSLLKWLDQDRARPFFAVVNYFDVHYPYAPPKRYEAKFYDGGIQLDCRIGARRTLNPFSFWDAWEQFAHLSPECLHQQMNEYDGAIAYVDDQVRALMSELQKRALDKNTLVVITSDHGESFREHGLVFHGTALYLEQIHIPLIFWAPGRIPAARRVTAPVSIASIPSTVADLLGNGSEKSFPLPSLAQLWNNAPQSQVLPPPISELVQDRYVPKESPVYQGWMKSVLDSEWHMVISEKLPTELYDWPQDPSETKDLAHDAQNTDVIRELNEKLWRELTPKKSASFPARPFHVPQDTKQAKSSGP
jgi:arylsulfatase A-like enzyme